jgi:hypothetical protein
LVAIYGRQAGEVNVITGMFNPGALGKMTRGEWFRSWPEADPSEKTAAKESIPGPREPKRGKEKKK